MCYFPTDHFKAVLLLQFFFVCVSIVSYVPFALSLFVSRLDKAVLGDCVTDTLFWLPDCADASKLKKETKTQRFMQLGSNELIFTQKY